MKAHTKENSASPRTLTTAGSSLLRRKCACGNHTTAGAECKQCKGGSLQRKSIGGHENKEVPSIVHDVLRSPGQPLDKSTREFFEPRFNHDFSRVKVHTDARAARSADAVNALAYTVGENIVLGAGRYSPASSGGRKLIAHELTHVVQQAGGGGDIQTASLKIDPSDSAEREAQRTAEDMVSASPAPGDTGSGKKISNVKSALARLSSISLSVQREERGWPGNGYVINESDQPVEVAKNGKDSYMLGPHSTSSRFGQDVDHIRDKHGQWYKIGPFTVTVSKNGKITGYECMTDGNGLDCASTFRSDGKAAVSTFGFTATPSKGKKTSGNALQKPDVKFGERDELFLKPVNVVKDRFKFPDKSPKPSNQKPGSSMTSTPTFLTTPHEGKGDGSEGASAFDIVHGALDLVGFIPGLGIAGDALNAILYMTEGDWKNAGISLVAMVPILGDGAKLTIMGGKTVVKISRKTALELTENGIAKAIKEARILGNTEKTVVMAGGGFKIPARIFGNPKLGNIMEMTAGAAVEMPASIAGSIRLGKIMDQMTKASTIGGAIAGVEVLDATGAETPKDNRSDCEIERDICVASRFGNLLGKTYNSTRCYFCAEACERNGGTWRSTVPTSSGNIRCDYWNSEGHDTGHLAKVGKKGSNQGPKRTVYKVGKGKAKGK